MTGAGQQPHAPAGTAQALTSNGTAAPQLHQQTDAVIVSAALPANATAPGDAQGHNDKAVAPDPTYPAAAAAQLQLCAGSNEVALESEPAQPRIESMAPVVAEQTKRLSEVRLVPDSGVDCCSARLPSSACHAVRRAEDVGSAFTSGSKICVPPQMLIEARQLHDAVLETRVQLAKTTNRLIQLDNPVLRTKLRELKRKADAVIAEHGV